MNHLKIAITGAAGQVSYALIFRIASGEVFGPNTTIDFNLLEIPMAMKTLEGIKMELEDCAFPLLNNINITSDPYEAFDNINWALLVGSRPRGPGMERNDLIKINGPIFVEQGKALNAKAAKDVKILVVGNPANTNCLIAAHYAPNIPKNRFSALTRLDQNRAASLLSKKLNKNIEKISNVIIWGNHSNTQYPSLENTIIDGKYYSQNLIDENWLQNEFIKKVQNRGAEVIATKGSSSAASAANAIIDHIKNCENKTAENKFFSAAVYSDGSYGVDEGLFFSFPVQSDGQGNLSIVKDLKLSDFSKEKIEISLEELRREKEIVRELLK